MTINGEVLPIIVQGEDYQEKNIEKDKILQFPPHLPAGTAKAKPPSAILDKVEY
jgi:hypothetical protein